MSRTPVARLLVAAVGLGAAAVAVRRLRGPAAPAFLGPPTAPAGLLRPEPATRAPARPDATSPEPEPPVATGPSASSAPSEPGSTVPEAGSAEPEPADRPAPRGERWVFPLEDGRCPPSHPIKAKLRSGLYHEVGMANYDRTHPDRCYATAVDAEADGLRRAKH